MLDGYQPGDPMVAVFACHAACGRPAREIAAEAFDIFNDHPRDAAGAELAWAYYGRKLRSLSFPGKSLCCNWLCCVRGIAVLRFRCGSPPALFTSPSHRVLPDGPDQAVAVIIRVKASSRAGCR
jgi:hypothetical protein